MTLSRADVEAAATRIAGRVRRTPVLAVEAGALGAEPVTLKLELLQHTGSFKPRGAFNRVLGAGAPPAAGAIAASGGNHGLAVAHVGAALGLRTEVFVPASASAVKVAGIHALGATVTVGGDWYADAFETMLARSAATGALVVHAYDSLEVAAGQGTLGLEAMEQAPDVDTVLVAVGGGGLLAGVAAAYDGAARVIAVEPSRIPTLARALEAQRPVDVDVSGIAADSLGARRIGSVGFDVAVAAGVGSVLVGDDAITDARRLLWQRCRVLAEPGGAVAVAALLSGAYAPAPGERVLAIVCGGNTDPAGFA